MKFANTLTPLAFVSALLVATVNSGDAATAAVTKLLSCDASMKAEFDPDGQTKVLLVENVKKGTPFPNPTMEQLAAPQIPTRYGADLCHVKMLVGPPSPGPADAPSTSAGLGIEVWLPEKNVWNGRFHAVGGSGSTGSEEIILNKISSWTGGLDVRSAPRIAAEEGSVTSSTDSGKGNDRGDGFLMNPDGSINNRAIYDWKYRALHEQAIKTKALIEAYYGSPPKHSYFDGASGGGRQAFHVVQNLPEQYDGIIAGVPALNWYQFIGNIYPSVVMLRDLGGKVLSKDKLTLVSNAAIAACDVVDGKHLGFVIDYRSCRYDPTKDADVLCASAGGKNTSDACVTREEALAINKIWYGLTIDGSVPDPAIDNGWTGGLASGVRRWYGLPRGTDLSSYATLDGWALGNDVLALAMGDPKLGSPFLFKNATGNGQNAISNYSYSQLASAFERARDVLPDLSGNNPDLSAFMARGGKLISVAHGNDELLWAEGNIHYYERVLQRMGGLSKVQSFFRLYMVPGLAHGEWNGTSNPAANPPVQGKGQMFKFLVDWVEKGVAPANIVFSSTALGDEAPKLGASGVGPGKTSPNPVPKSLPLCAYPAQPTFVKGDIFKAASYVCK